jgi:two-component system sensor histidine kinase/response regulator
MSDETSAPGSPVARPDRVLIAEDEGLIALAMRKTLVEQGYDVVAVVATEGEAVAAALHDRPDLILMDIHLKGPSDGVAAATEIHRQLDVPIVFLTAYADRDTLDRAKVAAPHGYLVKPVSGSELRATIEMALHRHRADRDARDQLRLLRELQARMPLGDLDTAERQIEQQVALRTADLVAENAELEAFAAAVAHDLQAPLRGIDGFSAALSEDAGPALDEDARGHLQRIQSSTRRMRVLIEGLLQLSRAGRTALAVAPVDVSALAAAVIGELRSREPRREVDVHIAAGIRVFGDPALVRALLDNLLGNAWKFTGRAAAPAIEVAALHDGAPGFSVRDNGAGFDMAFAHRLFRPFERLHGATDFEGTGIGLATVERIVRRHGGRIWCDAAPGRGALFSLILAPAPTPGALTPPESAA